MIAPAPSAPTAAPRRPEESIPLNLGDAQAQSGRIASQLRETVASHPGVALAAAAGIGLVIRWWAKR